MVMGDGTVYRDYGSYGSWERKTKRKELCKKILLRFLQASLFFFLGMGTQYIRDAEIREGATANITRELSIIESMPELTEAQKAEARKRAKKITPQYLNERKSR